MGYRCSSEDHTPASCQVAPSKPFPKVRLKTHVPSTQADLTFWKLMSSLLSEERGQTQKAPAHAAHCVSSCPNVPPHTAHSSTQHPSWVGQFLRVGPISIMRKSPLGFFIDVATLWCQGDGISYLQRAVMKKTVPEQETELSFIYSRANSKRWIFFFFLANPSTLLTKKSVHLPWYTWKWNK